jgi:hypothetical protein
MLCFQGERMAELNMTVPDMCLRKSIPLFAKGQVGFFNFIGLPFIHLWSKVGSAPSQDGAHPVLVVMAHALSPTAALLYALCECIFCENHKTRKPCKRAGRGQNNKCEPYKPNLKHRTVPHVGLCHMMDRRRPACDTLPSLPVWSIGQHFKTFAF